MKRLTQYVFVMATLLAASSHASIITVNNIDNTNFGAGVTNLVTALTLLGNGDTIRFNITNAPATGPHYLVTPVGGYPIITNVTGITIDGYSQPGSSPNTHTILASNNANITIVLDSSNGECTDLTGLNGYSQEGGVLPVLGCTNVNIRGLCFLGINPAGVANNGDDLYAIPMGGGEPTTDVHIHGCRFGLDLDNTTVKRFQKNITAYGAGADGACFVGVITNSPSPRAEFNIFIGGYIPIEIELSGQLRLSGNFINVYPDGLHDFNVDGNTYNGVDHKVEALFEFGSPGPGSVIGTDGDGVNDAEERNIIGGVTAADDGNVWECFGDGPRTLRFCGNYCGVGVDGITRFNNGGPDMLWLDVHGKNHTTMIVGSDFDGVSDDVEANLFYWNNPFALLYGSPPTIGAGGSWAWLIGPNQSGPSAPDGYISVRGNKMVNNLLIPYMYADDTGTLFPNFVNYCAPFMDTSTASTPDDLLPKLSASSTAGDIIGTCPLTNGIVYTSGTNSFSYSNIFIDVYVLDPDGWDNGKLFHLSELTDNLTYTNGFPQGNRYLGTFVDNGPMDRDPTVGRFNFNAGVLGLTAGTQITVTANYSSDPPGTRGGRVHTSNFSNPVTLRPPLRITAVSRSATTTTITWTGGTGPFKLQRKSGITGAWVDVQVGLAGPSTAYTDTGAQAYYRIVGN